jgi:NTP pyrophosphatase (non-canonical NTP hydrolase)
MMTDDTTTIAQIQQKVAEFKKKRGWGKEDPKDMALSLVLESAEVLELFQWLTGNEVQNNPKITHAIGEELSDVLWWIVSLGERLGLDIAKEFEQKVEKTSQKYSEKLFNTKLSEDEKMRSYYKIKAATRGGHPLYEDSKKGEK